MKKFNDELINYIKQINSENDFISKLKHIIEISDLKVEKNMNKTIINYNPKVYNIVFVGESGGAKTSLVDRIVNDRFSYDTRTNMTAAFKTKEINLINGEIIKLEIWDTAGAERYRAQAKIFMKKANVMIIGFDVTVYRTFKEIKNLSGLCFKLVDIEDKKIFVFTGIFE